MTPRKAAVLAMNLPAGARTWISCGTDASWTQESHMSAAMIDALNFANWQRAGDSKAKRPEPVKRPAAAKESADYHSVRAQAFRDRQRRARQPDQEV